MAKREHDYTADGCYLYIKAHNPYVHGVVGTDIKLTFRQKIKILFCKGVCVCIGDAIKKDGKKGRWERWKLKNLKDMGEK